MTEKEIRLWMLKEKAPDAWWLSIDGEATGQTVQLEDAADRAADQPELTVQVLHVSQAEVKDPPWVPIEPDPVMSTQERESFRLKRPKRGKGLFIQLALLLILLIAAAVILIPEAPVEAEQEALPFDPFGKEKLMQELSAIDSAGRVATPSVRAVVARTGHLLFVTNQNKEAWPSCVIWLDDQGTGYVYRNDEPVPPERTLQIPLRRFSKDGEAVFDLDRFTGYVIIEVPGYKAWEDRF